MQKLGDFVGIGGDATGCDKALIGLLSACERRIVDIGCDDVTRCGQLSRKAGDGRCVAIDVGDDENGHETLERGASGKVRGLTRKKGAAYRLCGENASLNASSLLDLGIVGCKIT